MKGNFGVRAWVFGSLLLATALGFSAVLKLQSLESLNFLSGFFGNTFVLFLVAVELLMATKLFLDRTNATTIGMLVLLFSIFLVASAAFTLLGQSSCSCLGRYDFWPGWLFIFDSAALASIALCSPIPISVALKECIIRKSARFSLLFISCLFLIGVYIEWLPSGRNLAATLRQESLRSQVGISVRTISELSSIVNVPIANHGNTEISICGFQKSCGVQLLSTLPIRIPPNGTVWIKASVSSPETSHLDFRHLIFITDDRTQPEVYVTLRYFSVPFT